MGHDVPVLSYGPVDWQLQFGGPGGISPGVMFALTREERLILALVIGAGLMGMAVAQWRAQQRESRPVPEQREHRLPHEKNPF